MSTPKKMILIFILSFYSTYVFSQELVIQTGHSAAINDIKYSANGKYFLTASSDGSIKLWDSRSFDLIRSLYGHSGEVIQADFFFNDSVVISASKNDSSLYMWDVFTGKIITKSKVCPSVFVNARKLFCLNNSKSKLFLLAVDRLNEKYIAELDLRTLALLKKYKLKINGFLSLEWMELLEDDKTVFLGTPEKLIFYDLDSLKQIHEYSITFEAGFESSFSIIEKRRQVMIRTGNYVNYIYSFDMQSEKSTTLSLFENNTAFCFSADSSIMYAAGSNSNNFVSGVKAIDLRTQNELFSLNSKNILTTSIVCSPDNKILILGGISGDIKIFNLNEKELIKEIDPNPISEYVCFHPKYPWLYINSKETYRNNIFDLTTLDKVNGSSGISKLDSPNLLYPENFDLTGDILTTSNPYFFYKMENEGYGKETKLYLYNLVRKPKFQEFENPYECKTIFIHKFPPSLFLNPSFNKSFSKMAVLAYDMFETDFQGNPLLRNISIIDLKLSTESELNIAARDPGFFIDNDSSIIVPVLKSYKVKLDSIVNIFGGIDSTINFYCEFEVWSIKTKTKLRESSYKFPNVDICNISSNSLTLAFTLKDNFSVFLMDIKTMKIFDTLSIDESPVISIAFNQDNNFIATLLKNGNTKLWSMDESNELLNFFTLPYSKIAQNYSLVESTEFRPDEFNGSKVTELVHDDSNYLIYTSDFYYLATIRNLDDILKFRINNRVFPPSDQFVNFNRPDIVLSKVNKSDSTVMALHKAYLSHESKLKYRDPRNIKVDIPILELDYENNISFVSNDSIASLNLSASVEKNILNVLNIWINNVPIYGSQGKNLRNLNSSFYRDTIPLILNRGLNKIKINVVDTSVNSSLFSTLLVNYRPLVSVKPNLYIIGIGCSEYKKFRPLNGCDMDVKMFVNNFLKKEGKDFNKVVIDTVLNESVSRNIISKFKSKLLESKVDDYVIVFFSGHGFINKNTNIFGTFEIDYSTLFEKGIPFDTLYDILDGIKARKKLMLINACHSGDIVPDLKIYGLEKKYFRNLTAENGTNVIVSSNYSESSWTEQTDTNSLTVFGEALNNAMNFGVLNDSITNQNNPADLNKDGHVSISELQYFLKKTISNRTSGNQTPDFRFENVENNFIFW